MDFAGGNMTFDRVPTDSRGVAGTEGVCDAEFLLIFGRALDLDNFHGEFVLS